MAGAVIAIWVALFFIGTVIDITTWVEFVTFMVGFVISDLIYDWVMKKRDPRTMTDMFLNYFVAVLGGSLVAEYASSSSVSTLQLFYTTLYYFFPSLSFQERADMVVAIGTTIEVVLGFGASWRILSTERRLRKRLPPR